MDNLKMVQNVNNLINIDAKHNFFRNFTALEIFKKHLLRFIRLVSQYSQYTSLNQKSKGSFL